MKGVLIERETCDEMVEQEGRTCTIQTCDTLVSRLRPSTPRQQSSGGHPWQVGLLLVVHSLPQDLVRAKESFCRLDGLESDLREEMLIFFAKLTILGIKGIGRCVVALLWT